jgi:hypothetical protein
VADNIWCSKVKPREWKGLKPEKPVGGIYAVEAHCSTPDCGKVFRLELHRMEPPQSCIKKIERQGWRIGNKITCPQHSGRTRPQKEEAMGTDNGRQAGAGTTRAAALAGTSSGAAGVALATAASDAARLGKRMVYQWLEECYSPGPPPGYKDGMTDARVAQECNVSPELVKKIREEDFGPLSAPPELIAVQDQLTAGYAKATEMEREARRFRGDLDQLKAHLADLCVKNGWKQ